MILNLEHFKNTNHLNWVFQNHVKVSAGKV